MTGSGAPDEAARKVAAGVSGRADELAAQWLASVGDGAEGDAGASGGEAGKMPTDEMKAAGADLVRGVASLIGDGSAADGSAAGGVVTTSHTLAKKLFNAGIDRPTGMRSLDVLGDAVMDAGEAVLADLPDATSHAAFDVANRIHRALRTVVTAIAEGYDDSIAHELKNPLGAARGAAELLLSGEGVETPEMREQFTQLVLRNINRTLELLDTSRGKATNPNGG